MIPTTRRKIQKGFKTTTTNELPHMNNAAERHVMLEEDKRSNKETIETNQDKRILGITTLSSQLFIVCVASQQVDIYNTTDFTKTGHVTVSDMMYPRSLVSCSHHNCLYISDWRDYIHRVELSERSVTK